MADTDQTNLTSLTIDLLSAYVANNNVQHGDLADLIKSTHNALKSIHDPEPESPAEPIYSPAVSARKSLASPKHIISMIDGKPYQTLKRHLSRHGLSPNEYRQRYNLPTDYPMVSRGYSEQRRAIAQKLGLGRQVKSARVGEAGVQTPASDDTAAASTSEVTVTAARGRRAGTKPAAAQTPAVKAGAGPKGTTRAKPDTVAPEATRSAATPKSSPRPVGKAGPAGKDGAGRKAVAAQASPAKRTVRKPAPPEAPAAQEASTTAPAAAGRTKRGTRKAAKAPAASL